MSKCGLDIRCLQAFQSPMRIAYYSDNFYPEISGISDSIITTGTELARRGHEVMYVAPWYPAKSYKASRDAERDKLYIVRLPSIPMPNSPTGQSRIALPIGRSISLVRAFKPDVIHVQSPYGTGLEGMLTAKLLGIPLVGTNHTPLEEFLHYVPGGTFIKAPALVYDSWFYNRCRLVTAPYYGLITEMRSHGFKRPGQAMPNPVPFMASPKNEEQKAVCKTELNIPGRLILSSGRLAPEKNVDVVLHALKKILPKFPDVILAITGHGSHEKSLKALAHKLGIEKNMRFVGFVMPDKLEQLYCTAEVYVVMSTAETQSLSLMQGFANGVPAVAARARRLIYFVPPPFGFFFSPRLTQ